MRRERDPSPLKLFSILAIGMLAVSAGAILVRFSQQAEPLVIAFYRVGWSSVLLAPFYFRRAGRAPLTVLPAWQLAAGLGLSLHFALWIASLRHTTVAVSVLLINTAPVMIALVGGRLFGEKLTRRGLAGLVLAFVGGCVLVVSDLLTFGTARGALLALGGAVALSLYLIAGRHLRQELHLMTYAWRTYLLAALTLGLLVLLAGSPVGDFSFPTHMFLFLLAAGPQCIGHTSYNWSLRYLPATLVAALILAEPVLAPVWAWWLLNEAPGPTVAAGGGLVAAGLVCLSSGGVRLISDPSAQISSLKPQVPQ